MIKAGYRANLRLFPNTPLAVAADDRREEVALLDEMYPRGSRWKEIDDKLTEEAETLVNEYWDAIRAIAAAVLAQACHSPLQRELSILELATPY